MTPDPTLDPNVQDVIMLLQNRAQYGLRKYGHDTTRLCPSSALDNLQQELLDAAVYINQFIAGANSADRAQLATITTRPSHLDDPVAAVERRMAEWRAAKYGAVKAPAIYALRALAEMVECCVAAGENAHTITSAVNAALMKEAQRGTLTQKPMAEVIQEATQVVMVLMGIFESARHTDEQDPLAIPGDAGPLWLLPQMEREIARLEAKALQQEGAAE